MNFSSHNAEGSVGNNMGVLRKWGYGIGVLRFLTSGHLTPAIGEKNRYEYKNDRDGVIHYIVDNNRNR